MPRMHLIPLNNKNKGLWIVGPREKTNSDYLRRNEGIHLLRETELRSRSGTTADAAIAAAHSVFKYNSIRYQGATTVLYKNAVSVDTGYNGTPLEFSVSEPRTGTNSQYLFVSGGGQLRKVDASGTATQWGISPPSAGVWGTSVGGSEEAITAVTVVDPQEKTIALTTSTNNWSASGDTGGAGPSAISGQNNPTGVMICIQAEEQGSQEQET